MPEARSGHSGPVEIADQYLVASGAEHVAAGAAVVHRLEDHLLAVIAERDVEPRDVGIDDGKPHQRIVGEGGTGLRRAGRAGERSQQVLGRVGVGVGAVGGDVALGVVGEGPDPARDLVEPVGGGRGRSRAVARPGISVVGALGARDLARRVVEESNS